MPIQKSTPDMLIQIYEFLFFCLNDFQQLFAFSFIDSFHTEIFCLTSPLHFTNLLKACNHGNFVLSFSIGVKKMSSANITKTYFIDIIKAFFLISIPFFLLAITFDSVPHNVVPNCFLGNFRYT